MRSESRGAARGNGDRWAALTGKEESAERKMAMVFLSKSINVGPLTHSNHASKASPPPSPEGASEVPVRQSARHRASCE